MKQYPILSKNQMIGMYVRAGADVVCWTAASAWLVVSDYPTIAAVTAATGIVYILHVAKAINGIRKATAAFEAEVNEMVNRLPTPEDLEHLYDHLKQFDDFPPEDPTPKKSFMEMLDEIEDDLKK